jgi:hypothetical protein
VHRRLTDNRNQQGVTTTVATPLFRVNSETGEAEAAKNHNQRHTHTGWTPAGRTKGGPSCTRAMRPRCPTRMAPPTRTRQPRRPTTMTKPTKPPASELFMSPLVQILIPCRSKCTSARSNYGGGSKDALDPARGCFARRAPTKIPAYWLKRSPSEGRTSGGEV